MHALVRGLIVRGGAVALAAASISCGEVARTGRSPSLLVIDAITAASGAAPDTFSGFLLSDVQTLVERTLDGETTMVPTIFNDIGQATLRVVMKDQGTAGTGIEPSALNAITVNRYRITYRRADGRNTPGVDVPFSVDGAVTATVTNIPTTLGFEMVRHQAKEEAPLRALIANGGRMLISTIAEITFYGVDLAGNDVQATGTINVSFGDYADPS